MSEQQPARGNAIFYESCIPPLVIGDDYSIEVKHKLGDNLDATAPLGKNIQKFAVTGPRYRLNPDDIHAAYPPPNSVGPFDMRLPMVVLRRRTLPWERLAGTGSDNQGVPWMALLLFEEDEVVLLDPPDCTVGYIVDGDDTAGVPKSNIPPEFAIPEKEKKEKCLGIQVSLEKFKEVAPTMEELKLLTHVRQVNTEDKELLGQDKDGWFAVSVCNRLPAAGKKYVACLVSLEGQLHLLPIEDEVPELSSPVSAIDAGFITETSYVRADLTTPQTVRGEILPKTGVLASDASYQFKQENLLLDKFHYDLDTGSHENIESLRFITLARWTFSTFEEPGDFQSIMQVLPQKGGIAMLGMEQSTAIVDEAVTESDYRVALDTGHVPLKHQTRSGEHKVSFYRGPLSPVGVERKNDGPYHNADQARIVDPLTGMENVGYAAAFEIGRLMALAEPKFAIELLKWRRSGNRRLSRVLTHELIKDHIREIIDIESFSDIFDPDFLIDRFLTDQIFVNLGTDLLEENLLGALIDPTGLNLKTDSMPGFNTIQVAEAKGLSTELVESMISGTTLGASSVIQDTGLLNQAPIAEDFSQIDRNIDSELSNLDASWNNFTNIPGRMGR